ncbi:MAG: methyltransferase, partial [Polyangiaceae bacterium]
MKHARVVLAFERYPSTSRIEPVLAASRIEGYRGRAKLIVSNEGKIGLFAKSGGHRVVDIPGCRVMTPTIARVTAKLREIIRTDKAASAIRAFDLREVENPTPKLLVTFVVERQSAPPNSELQRMADALRASEPAVVGVAANFREVDAPQVLGDVTTHLSGATQAPDAHGRSTHLATYGSFVQAHRDQAACVHDLVLGAIRKIEKKAPAILDLYGGSGAIGLALAKGGAVVELVESFPPAVERARDAAKSQGLRLHGTASDVGRALRDFIGKNRRFDAAVTNPPR